MLVEVVGDLALHLTWSGRSAEVGYTLAAEHWGKGYAVEPLEALVENYRAVYELRTHRSQESMVAPMAGSFANALFPELIDGAPVGPWMRALEADGELVAFAMLALSTDHHSEPYLWRLLIDRLHQRRGIGGRVLGIVADMCRERGDSTLMTSWVEGRGSPRPFYERHGFVPTGRDRRRRVEARWVLPA